jgi:hypothetical protein
MNEDQRDIIADMDAAAKGCDLPTYTELVELLTQGQVLVEHRGLVRMAWVQEVSDAVGRIQTKR